MKIIDSFKTVEPVQFFNQSVSMRLLGGVQTDITDVFEGFYTAKVEIYEKDGKLYARKEIIDSPEYQNILKAKEGRKIHRGFTKLGVCLDCVLSELETKELEDNKLGKEGEVEKTSMHDFLYDNKNLLGLNDSKRILILCSGYGTLVEHIKDVLKSADINPRITAIDINPDAVKNSRDIHSDVEHFEGNIASMPFPAGSFDYVIADMAFSSLVWPRTGIKESSRVLSRNGFLLTRECYLDTDYVEKAVKEEGFKLPVYQSYGQEYGMPVYCLIGNKK